MREILLQSQVKEQCYDSSPVEVRERQDTLFVVLLAAIIFHHDT